MTEKKVKISMRFCNVVGATVTLLSLLWIASPASAGTISGQVTNSMGTGIADVWVDAYDTSWNYMNSGYTQSDGSYSIEGLPTGSYKLKFTGGDSGYVTQWYNNKTSFDDADFVAVTEGSTTGGIDATMVLGGTVSGRVTNSSGSGIAGVWVHAYDASSYYINGGYTQADGNYTIVGIPTGNIRLEFNGRDSGYVSQWYNNKTSMDSADAVAVTEGSTTGGIDATMVLGGTVTGQVTNSTGTGIADVWVDAYDSSGNWMNSGYTQADGNYTIVGLPTGSYKLKFIGGDSGYVTQWYNNKTSMDSADAVAVTEGSTTGGIDATMVLGGTVSGRVTNSSGSGIAGVWVQAYDSSWNNICYNGYTQADGTYTIVGLPTGSYKLKFNGGDSGYVTQWYNNKTSMDSADAVAVTAGGTTNGINATLALGGTVSGRVTNSSGGGIAGVWVYAYDASSYYINGGYTQADGTYTIVGLPTGNYRLEFNGGDSGYLGQWYNNKASFDSADAVVVTAGSITGGINAVLIPSDVDQVTLDLTISGSGSGTVTSNPTGIATNTSVSAQFSKGSALVLHATLDQYSLFSGWSGDCIGTGDCSLAMDTDKSVTATFDKNTAEQVRLNGTYYSSIMGASGAYQAATSGNTILIWGTELIESFIFDGGKAVALEGGYDSDYMNNSGYTTFIGPVTLQNGSLTVENLIIE